MRYDKELRMFVLTNESTRRLIGIDLANLVDVENTDFNSVPAMIDNILLEISEKVYNYIYSFNPANQEVIAWAFANDEALNKMLERCFLSEVKYLVKNGDFYNYSGVNILKSNSIDLERIRGAAMLSAQTTMMLDNARIGQYPLLYMGTFPYEFRKAASNWDGESNV